MTFTTTDDITFKSGIASWTPTNVPVGSDPSDKTILELKMRKPDGSPPATPCIIHVHGGGFTGGSRGDTNDDNVLDGLANAGYNVCSIDYRLPVTAYSLPTQLYDVYEGSKKVCALRLYYSCNNCI